jgi:hypothetical protein
MPASSSEAARLLPFIRLGPNSIHPIAEARLTFQCINNEEEGQKWLPPTAPQTLSPSPANP